MILSVNETNFKQEVLEASGTVLVHFWTPWCGLCRLINPMLESLQQEENKSIKLVSLNADENFKTTNCYQLRNLPTILLFQDGRLVKKLDKFEHREQLYLALEAMMNNTLSFSQ